MQLDQGISVQWNFNVSQFRMWWNQSTKTDTTNYRDDKIMEAIQKKFARSNNDGHNQSKEMIKSWTPLRNWHKASKTDTTNYEMIKSWKPLRYWHKALGHISALIAIGIYAIGSQIMLLPRWNKSAPQPTEIISARMFHAARHTLPNPDPTNPASTLGALKCLISLQKPFFRPSLERI